MGGTLSSRWGDHRKASTVAGSMALPIAAVLRYDGTIRWHVRGREIGSLGYALHRDAAGAPVAVTLCYALGPVGAEPELLAYAVELVTQTTAIGTLQRFWRCPGVVGGVPCRRPVRTLYLPPGERIFACRHCHGLVYAASQQHDKNAGRWFAIQGARIDRLVARHEAEMARRR